jgi:hypothetical protein
MSYKPMLACGSTRVQRYRVVISLTPPPGARSGCTTMTRIYFRRDGRLLSVEEAPSRSWKVFRNVVSRRRRECNGTAQEFKLPLVSQGQVAPFLNVGNSLNANMVKAPSPLMRL